MNDEILNELVKAFWNNIDYWENQSVSTREKLEGVVFSTLSSIDGSGPPFKKNNLVNNGTKIDEELHSAFYERRPDNEEY